MKKPKALLSVKHIYLSFYSTPFPPSTSVNNVSDKSQNESKRRIWLARQKTLTYITISAIMNVQT